MPYSPRVAQSLFRGTAQIPDPHPVLLEAHAEVARILHMIAMAEHIDNVLRDREVVSCLASDESSDLGYLLMAF